MPSPVDYIGRFDFSGGVNDDLFATLIGENQVTSLQNISHRNGGELQSITGNAQIGNTAVASRARGLFQYTTSAGVEYLVGADSQPHLWSIKSGDTTFTDGGALTSFTAGNEVYGVQLLNRLFLVDGSERMLSWDATNIRRSTDTNVDPPSALKGLVVYFNRLFGWKGDKLYYSRTLFPYTSEPSSSSFTGGWDRTIQILDVGAGGGQNIVHCEAYRNDELIVFMERSIYRVVNAQKNLFGLTIFGNPAPASFVIQPISIKIGCGARDSVVQVGSDMFFRDQEGEVRSLRSLQTDDARIDALPLSKNIRATIAASAKLYNSKSAAVYFNGQYHVSYAGAAQTDVSQTSTFDINLTSWAGPHTWVGTRFRRSSYTGQTLTYFTKPENSFKVYQLESGTGFDGAAISFSMQTRRENHAKPWQEKIGKFVVFFFETGDDSEVEINVAINGGSFQSLTTLNLDGGAGTLPQVLPFTLGGEGVLPKYAALADLGPYFDIQFQVIHADLGVTCKLLGYIIASDLRDIRQSFVDFGANAGGTT